MTEPISEHFLTDSGFCSVCDSSNLEMFLDWGERAIEARCFACRAHFRFELVTDHYD